MGAKYKNKVQTNGNGIALYVNANNNNKGKGNHKKSRATAIIAEYKGIKQASAARKRKQKVRREIRKRNKKAI